MEGQGKDQNIKVFVCSLLKYFQWIVPLGKDGQAICDKVAESEDGRSRSKGQNIKGLC